MRFWVLIPAVLASVSAQPSAEPRPEITLLNDGRAKMYELLLHQPNYTCLETVERMRQIPGAAQQVEDTLRLEVALVDNREMFAWPGAKEFTDQDIREVVATGMFGNGNYATYARMLFREDGPEFVYRGTAPLNGSPAARYDFQVPRAKSGYHLRVDTLEGVTGFHGSIYLNPENADLRRLEVIADDIPAELGLTVAEDRVDYARVGTGEDAFLLPVESSLTMGSKEMVSRNRVRFSNCRKFAGESSLIFEDPELVELEAKPAVREVALPAGTTLGLTITSDVLLESAAVGDAVEAKLQSDVKQGKQVLAPKGAVARGRVILLLRNPGFYTLGFQFFELEWKGGHASFRALFERLGSLSAGNRSRIVITPEGAMLVLRPGTRTMKGEFLFYRTVR